MDESTKFGHHRNAWSPLNFLLSAQRDVCQICNIGNEHMHAAHIESASGQDCTLIASQAMLVNLK
jgi:hypothetical protein